jgi:hypothetical protein
VFRLHLSFQSKTGRAKIVAREVAGRNNIVMTAIVFIDELSSLAAAAIAFAAFAALRLETESS